MVKNSETEISRCRAASDVAVSRLRSLDRRGSLAGAALALRTTAFFVVCFDAFFVGFTAAAFDDFFADCRVGERRLGAGASSSCNANCP